jgi:hypothetical protein
MIRLGGTRICRSSPLCVEYIDSVLAVELLWLSLGTSNAVGIRQLEGAVELGAFEASVSLRGG